MYVCVCVHISKRHDAMADYLASQHGGPQIYYQSRYEPPLLTEHFGRVCSNPALCMGGPGFKA
jgi:hypothetical protein